MPNHHSRQQDFIGQSNESHNVTPILQDYSFTNLEGIS